MAGIGFRLRKYFAADSLVGSIKGTIYSIVISSGPWLITVLSVAFISYFAQRSLENKALFVFKSIICYTYAASLIFFGIIEMPITRYLADKLYLNDLTSFRNVYLSIMIGIILLGSFFSLIFYSFFDYSLLFKFLCMIFFVAVLSIWLAMVFLSAAKKLSSYCDGVSYGRKSFNSAWSIFREIL
jgi:uncharacterized membrane protein